MGVVHKPNPDWATHIPVLIKALELTDGPVLELGMGMMSTPLLHALCAAEDRLLMSFDNDRRYTDQFRLFENPRHAILSPPDWDKTVFDISKNFYDVVLVDHKPAERRKVDIARLTDASYMVIHDSEDPLYGYEEIYPLFKYRYNYKKFKTWTTVLSNKHELHQFHNSLG